MKHICMAIALLALAGCQRSVAAGPSNPTWSTSAETVNRVPDTSCVLSHLVIGNRHVFVVQSTDSLPCSVATVE